MDNVPVHGKARKTPSILLYGDALVDWQFHVRAIPQAGGDETIVSRAVNSGGSALNTAFDLAFLGEHPAFCSCVGGDSAGKILLDALKQAEIDTKLVDIHGETGYTVTLIDPSGERTMFSARCASADVPPENENLEFYCENTKIFLISGYTLQHAEQAAFALRLVQSVHRHGCTVFFDPAPVAGVVAQDILDEMLRFSDIVSPNMLELKILAHTENFNEAVERLSAAVPCLALKMGAKGAALRLRPGTKLCGRTYTGALELREPAQELDVADSTGAGDAFNAGFIAALLREPQPEAWLKGAVSTASLVVAREGAALLRNVLRFAS
jgi:sugar/nucleoside kinase (ribokinase family)